MNPVPVEKLLFTFEGGVDAEKYDDWTHYRGVLNRAPASMKAMDIAAVQTEHARETLWLIEAKDFRVITNPPAPSNLAGLAQTVADKTTDTLSGLADAAKNAADARERAFAAKATATAQRRVVLHLEPHTGTHTALFPKTFTASVLQRLRQLVASVDANPLVLNTANTPAAGVPWSVA